MPSLPSKSLATLSLLSALLGFSILGDAQADLLCVKNSAKVKSGKVKLSNVFSTTASSCPDKFTSIINTSSFTGPTGATGATGADGTDGSIRIYGDGSAGALTVSASGLLEETNLQFTNVTINSGVALTILSERTIRCSGTFTNNGTIHVTTSAGGGIRDPNPSPTAIVPFLAQGTLGIGRCFSFNGEYGTDTNTVKGGGVGCTMSDYVARDLRNLTANGGGGGGAGLGDAGAGGGTLTVLCAGAITNSATGTINAPGGDSPAFGGGGGGGGVILLASQTSVSNAGTIDVSGGDGGASSTLIGGGGGGSGGLIHLISPSNSNSGTSTVAGGSAGSNATSVATNPRFGGGSGGDSAGAGGSGSQVSANPFNLSSGNSAGSSGKTLTTTADPTSTF